MYLVCVCYVPLGGEIILSILYQKKYFPQKTTEKLFQYIESPLFPLHFTSIYDNI